MNANYYLQQLKKLGIHIRPEYRNYTSEQFEQLIDKHKTKTLKDNLSDTQSKSTKQTDNNTHTQSSNNLNPLAPNNKPSTQTSSNESNNEQDTHQKERIQQHLSTRKKKTSTQTSENESNNEQENHRQEMIQQHLSTRKKKREELFTIRFKQNIIRSLPDEIKQFFHDYDIQQPGFNFLYDIVITQPLAYKYTYNKRHYLFLKIGKFDRDDDGDKISDIITKKHFIKHYTMTYEMIHKEKHLFLSYFYFYFNDAVKIEISPADSWRIFHNLQINIVPNILSGNYGNKNLIYLNLCYEKNTAVQRKKDFINLCNIRTVNLLSYINFEDMFEHKNYWIKNGYDSDLEKDDDKF